MILFIFPDLLAAQRAGFRHKGRRLMRGDEMVALTQEQVEAVFTVSGEGEPFEHIFVAKNVVFRSPLTWRQVLLRLTKDGDIGYL